MSKELVLKRIVSRENKHYPDEIRLPLEETVIIQKYSPRGHVGATIELTHYNDKVTVLGTWGRMKVNITGEPYNRYHVSANKITDIQVGGKIYLGSDGIYQVQEQT